MRGSAELQLVMLRLSSSQSSVAPPSVPGQVSSSSVSRFFAVFQSHVLALSDFSPNKRKHVALELTCVIITRQSTDVTRASCKGIFSLWPANPPQQLQAHTHEHCLRIQFLLLQRLDGFDVVTFFQRDARTDQTRHPASLVQDFMRDDSRYTCTRHNLALCKFQLQFLSL